MNSRRNDRLIGNRTDYSLLDDINQARPALGSPAVCIIQVGRQAGKPFSRNLYDARRNKPKGQRYAAKNSEIAKPQRSNGVRSLERCSARTGQHGHCGGPSRAEHIKAVPTTKTRSIMKRDLLKRQVLFLVKLTQRGSTSARVRSARIIDVSARSTDLEVRQSELDSPPGNASHHRSLLLSGKPSLGLNGLESRIEGRMACPHCPHVSSWELIGGLTSPGLQGHSGGIAIARCRVCLGEFVFFALCWLSQPARW